MSLKNTNFFLKAFNYSFCSLFWYLSGIPLLLKKPVVCLLCILFEIWFLIWKSVQFSSSLNLLFWVKSDNFVRCSGDYLVQTGITSCFVPFSPIISLIYGRMRKNNPSYQWWSGMAVLSIGFYQNSSFIQWLKRIALLSIDLNFCH